MKFVIALEKLLLGSEIRKKKLSPHNILRGNYFPPAKKRISGYLSCSKNDPTSSTPQFLTKAIAIAIATEIFSCHRLF